MKMRLIDADTLIKDLSYLYTKNRIPVDMRAKETLSTIMEQSTACDTDKIVERLKEASYERFGNDGMGGELVINLDDAIEIVKEGGKDE
jgi:hypothetical protein